MEAEPVDPEVRPVRNAHDARGATHLRATDQGHLPQQTSITGEARSDTIRRSPAKQLDADRDESAERRDSRHADGRELYLIFDHNSGRVHVQIRDRAGNVVSTIPPSKTLSVVSGDRPD